MLTDPLKEDKTLLTLVCESASLEILEIVLVELGDRIKELENVKPDIGLSLFCMVHHRLGFEGVARIAKALNWVLLKHDKKTVALAVSLDKNFPEIIKRLQLTVEQGQGNTDEQNNLGLCYYYGIGVDKDCSQAVKYYQLAAEQGNELAQTNLGHCYYFDKGIAKDISQAMKYYQLAADQGHEPAKARLKKLSESSGQETITITTYKSPVSQPQPDTEKLMNTVTVEQQQEREERCLVM